MNNEIKFLIAQLNDTFEGDPWFGRPVQQLLDEINEDIAFEKPNGQHSIVELIWHMINWKEFAIYSLNPDQEKDLHYFEQNDWKDLDHSNKNLFQEGIKKMQVVQKELVNILQMQQDDILEKVVPGRVYSFRKLLNGVVQHDIYHLGQIAYLWKLLRR
jgi:uncharacterized damage-inducible protein DinB